ncbi:GTP pyrophosphokinase [Lachnoclostridium sp. MSJ-17]|uniref:GTP pyrophosphokinase n=1 Tax=Lachnoclostridium sp. MSJ-17 TaxID=2841516 RepID=UPI001C0FF081|nr:GTP pyrophosphokinase family protein [Lachnoclostridium sp. MSJ-17]MBU5462472.1 GTP pyrophosphokinase family protein [Lachnoclostridium sp. MSJ-17]
MNTQESIYGAHRPALEQVMDGLRRHIENIRSEMEQKLSMDPIEHCLSRIKSEESMREKCRRNNLPETTESALNILTDAIGLRIVCAFVDDVYTIRDCLKESGEYEVVKEKDYIRHAKPNGYRSYHMILRTKAGYFAEIQLRTISMDTWAALEHHLKYKKSVGSRAALIEEELKRCADELASTDLSMQTIRDMILEA